MINFFLSLFLLSSLMSRQGGVASQRIILKNGESFEDTIQYYKNSSLILKVGSGDPTYPGGRIIARQDIQEIKFLPHTTEPIKRFEDTIPVSQILENSLKAEQQFKDANGIILLSDESITLHPDGSRTDKEHFIGKILKPEKRDWATMELSFDETREKIEVLLARTIHPDGSVSYLDRSKIKTSMPAEEAVYLNKYYRVMSFELPDVSTGDIIECAWEERLLKPSDIEIFNPCNFFQSYEPVVSHKFTVIIPDTLELKMYSRNFSPESLRDALPSIHSPRINSGDVPASSPAVSPALAGRRGGDIQYSWEITNTPGIEVEPRMPGFIDIVPGVFTTLFKDWNYLFDREAKFELRRIEVTPEIQTLTNKIVEPAKTLDDSVALIYHWIQQNIRYMSIKGSPSSGTAGHPAGVTLKNKFGDCIDKSILLSTMLKAINVSAYPVSLLTSDRGHPPLDKIPISWGNHAITQVRLHVARGFSLAKDSVFYLDPTNETFRYPYTASGEHGVLCVNAIMHSIDTIPVPPPDWNAENYFHHASLDSAGDVTVTFKALYTGTQEAIKRLRWKYSSEDEKPHKIQEILCEQFPGAMLIDYKISPYDKLGEQFSESWTYKLKDYPLKASDLWIFRIPGPEKQDFPEVALAERKYNLEYSTSNEYTNEVHLTLPSGYKVVYLPSSIEIKCKYASYKAGYKELPNDVIEYKDKYSRWGHIIDTKDYKEYKDFLNKVAIYSTQQIFLKKPIL